jgi:ribosome-associated protein
MIEQLPEFLTKTVEFLDARKAESISVLDLREVANIADYFVVATAANAPHLKALADGMQRLCKDNHFRESRHAGDGNSGWVIADYDGVMIHVFSAEMRGLYDLEKLWKDAKRVELSNVEPQNKG